MFRMMEVVQLWSIYEWLEAIDASTVEKHGANILFGLGIYKEMHVKKTRELFWQLVHENCFGKSFVQELNHPFTQ